MEPLRKLLWNISQIGKSKGRDNSIVLIGAWFGNRFADNSRYLFQYLSENKVALGLTHVIWVTRSSSVCKTIRQMGYECYMMDGEESIAYHKKAGIHIICNSAERDTGDILVQYSCGAFKLNLWHGLGGIKGVEYASKQYELKKQANPLKYFLKELFNRNGIYRKLVVGYGGWGDCFYLSTTEFETEIFQQYFYRDKSHFIEAGYPRNEQCIKLTPNETEIIKLIQEKKNVILYLPTFREGNSKFQKPMSDPRFRKFIQSMDFFWIEKKHSVDKESNEGYDDHILSLDSTFDISTILPYANLVITDYSSVSWDALYFNIPVLFYVPDIEIYCSQERGFVLKKSEFMIGKKTETIEELIGLLQKFIKDFEYLKEPNYNEMKKKVWNTPTEYSEIWKKIKSAIR